MGSHGGSPRTRDASTAGRPQRALPAPEDGPNSMLQNTYEVEEFVEMDH